MQSKFLIMMVAGGNVDGAMIKQTRIILNKYISTVRLLQSLRRWLLLGAVAVLAGCASAPVEVPRTTSPADTAPAAAKKPPRIGLALGGGAARGFAHVGVIQVLEEAGIKPDVVTGTSAGSLVAALYASGKTGVQLQQVADSMEEAAFADWMLPIFNRGMLRGEALARYVNQQVGNRLIESMPLPLGIVATDLNSGQGVLFQRGDTGTAVRASSAVPSVFQPVSISGRDYVDGGLVSPVPVRYARQMGAELVIAVDISSAPEGNRRATACRSCCRPLPSWARASMPGNSRKPIWSCGLRWVGCAAQTSRHAAARSRQGGWPCSRRWRRCARPSRQSPDKKRPGLATGP
jgi:NTE family protein